jgi:glycerol-3-phosphate acyltransferase PlsY
MPFKAFLAFLTAFIVVFRHLENLKRLRDGTESKISFSRRSKAPKA